MSNLLHAARLLARRCAPAIALLAGSALATAHAAAADAKGDADAALEARLGAEMRATLSTLAESGAFGAQPVDQVHLDVALPAQRVSDLGLLVDSADERRDGVRVLGVTPGEQAQKIGVRSGDVIVAVDGASLAGRDHAAAELRRIVDALPDRADVAFDVVRGGQALALRGTVTSRNLPPMRVIVGDATTAAPVTKETATSKGDPDACGRISDFDVAPRQQQLHGARVLSIDGKAAGPTISHVFRVSAGAHTLEVGERIDARYLSFNDRQRQAGTKTGSKTLHVDVPADTTLLVAARLNADKQREWRDAAYWDPVVWKSVSERCR